MDGFEYFGRGVDELMAQSAVPVHDEDRIVQLKYFAAQTLKVYFLQFTNWVPNEQVAPSYLVKQWWEKAYAILDRTVENAWLEGREWSVRLAGLTAERYAITPGQDGFNYKFAVALGALTEIYGHWPELMPPSKQIPALQMPAARAPIAPAIPSTAQFVLGVNAANYGQVNTQLSSLIAQTQIADLNRFRSQVEWDNAQWWRTH